MPKPKAIHLSAAVWRSLRHEWLWVYRGPVPQCEVWSAEIPVPAGVFFVERGEVRIRADGKETLVPRGQAFFSSPKLRKHRFVADTCLLSVGFRSQWPDGTSLFRDALNFAAKTPALRKATQRLFSSIHGAKKVVTYRQAIEAAMYSASGWAAREAAFAAWFAVWIETLEQLGVQPAPQVRASRRRVDQIVAWLQALPLDQTTPSLPPNFPIGSRRAEQLMQQQFGSGMRMFMERRRLDVARERIVADHDTLKEIAFALGFRHASHFTAWFRRHTGVSPSEYRLNGVEQAA
ncbi:MAG: helix-turn-helix domain-containing protein [Prosthecobacter sp.]|uniref:helix-turn-helix domain-containing protein n=1 Tax=Prosthecobacter sp. TaxID=1965333 RepID=UPI0025E06863|nr:helix-turn-helix domain-containing protein [Prosthecobacter sp.]MCF7787932.1 helix-turn-helix domain-containing protein [Prosthecobacter sp.]